MLNLWLGLCIGDHGLPNDIRRLGYKLHSIEHRVSNLDNEQCVPELIACSESQSHSLLFEWKKGPNTDADQLRRYSRLNSKRLIENNLLPKQAGQSFDVVIVGQAEHFERLKLGIEGKYPFPLLVADESGLRLALNKFSCDKLNQVFSPGLKIDWNSAPMGYVPISEASDSWEVAERIIPHILQKMLLQASRVNASTLCAAICPLWDSIQKNAQSEILANVCETLRKAAASEFQAFLYWKKLGNDCVVEFVNNPIKVHGTKRQAAYRRLQKASRDFRDRLLSGKEFVFQPDLWNQDTGPLEP